MKDVRSRLKAKVSAEAVPKDLNDSIRQRIQAHERTKRRRERWLVIGGMAVVCAAVLLLKVAVFDRALLRPLEGTFAQEEYIALISAKLSPVMKLGLGDHLHCAVFRKYAANAPTLQHLAETLGPQWSGLLPIMTAAVPSGYQTMDAHRCEYRNRTFVHLTFRRRWNILSLVVTKKHDGETLATSSSGISTAGYSLAAFDAGDYWAFIASEEPSSLNARIATNVAPQLRHFLANSVVSLPAG